MALSQQSNDDVWLLFSLAFPRGTVQLNPTLSPSYVYLIEPPRDETRAPRIPAALSKASPTDSSTYTNGSPSEISYSSHMP